MADTTSNIGRISVDVNDDYFDTLSAVRISEKNSFTDVGTPSPIASNEQEKVNGLFSYRTTSSAKRSSSDIHNYIVSGTLQQADAYRNGIEIQDKTKWTAGVVKVSSGERGHLIRSPNSYGVTNLDVNEVNFFQEIDYFDPVAFVSIEPITISGHSVRLNITYPIITSDANQRENYIFNGIIEPLTIRSVVSFFSINAPFEPHSVGGNFGNGNYRRMTNSTDQVQPVFEYKPGHNKSHYLDGSDNIMFSNGTTTVVLGQSLDFFTQDIDTVEPFEDVVNPRDHAKTDTYANDLLGVVRQMPPGDETYVREKERSCITGFVYDDVGTAGIDSIAYGGLTYR